MIVQGIEMHRVCMFSAKEMAFNILGLMHPILFSITQVEPVWGNLSGGFSHITDLANMVTCICVNMNKKAELYHMIACNNATELKIINSAKAECILQIVNITCTNFYFEFPELPASSLGSNLGKSSMGATPNDNHREEPASSSLGAYP